MDQIVPKNALAASIKAARIVSDVEAQLIMVPEWQSLKGDLDFIQHCCELVRYRARKLSVVDQRALVVQILSKLFNMVDEEAGALAKHVDFMVNNKTVKQVKMSRVVFAAVARWVQKKLL